MLEILFLPEHADFTDAAGSAGGAADGQDSMAKTPHSR
jgi:hypothetical protein